MGCALIQVYSSETGTWSSSSTHSLIGQPPFGCHVHPMVRSSLLDEDTIHFAIKGGSRTLSYDIAKCSLTVITTPWSRHHGAGNMGLVVVEELPALGLQPLLMVTIPLSKWRLVMETGEDHRARHDAFHRHRCPLYEFLCGQLRRGCRCGFLKRE
jgi:hypothetical protein